MNSSAPVATSNYAMALIKEPIAPDLGDTERLIVLMLSHSHKVAHFLLTQFSQPQG